MPIPSLYISSKGRRAWCPVRAAAYGAGIGVLAGLFKIIGPLHHVASAPAILLQIASAAAVFALLCAGAAALRNFIARRLIWPELG